jgi:sortase A
MTTSARGIARFIEIPAWIVGAMLPTWSLTLAVSSSRYQRAANAALDDLLSAPAMVVTPEAHAPAAPPSVTPPPLQIGDIVGRLEIPRLGVSVVVAEGDDDGTLTVAAGHLPDTPLPWEAGNSALAAHRDSFFRPLHGIRADETLRLTTVHGTFRYRVTNLSIVTPDNLSVLQHTDVPSLTLITCYPFSYVGHAPKRFIVRAERIDEGATAAAP